jgi:uncharacterized membrane protein
MDNIQPVNSDAIAPAKIVYLLLLASLINGVTAIVGVIIAYVYRNDSGDWLKSHFHFQIRTFWIGMLYLAIGSMTTPILIGFLILFVVLIWFIVRCVSGYKALERQRAIEDSERWGF